MLALKVAGFLEKRHDQSVHDRGRMGILPCLSREDRVRGVRNWRHSAPGQCCSCSSRPSCFTVAQSGCPELLHTDEITGVSAVRCKYATHQLSSISA